MFQAKHCFFCQNYDVKNYSRVWDRNIVHRRSCLFVCCVLRFSPRDPGSYLSLENPYKTCKHQGSEVRTQIPSKRCCRCGSRWSCPNGVFICPSSIRIKTCKTQGSEVRTQIPNQWFCRCGTRWNLSPWVQSSVLWTSGGADVRSTFCWTPTPIPGSLIDSTNQRRIDLNVRRGSGHIWRCISLNDVYLSIEFKIYYY